jgi:hypothetical protein
MKALPHFQIWKPTTLLPSRYYKTTRYSFSVEDDFLKNSLHTYVSEHCISSSLFEFEPESDSLTITSNIVDSMVTLALVLVCFI